MEERKIIKTEKFPQLSYLKTGTGPACVLLHGFPESGELWRNVWPSLSENFTVIVPDLPGSGNSTWEQETITMEQLAESVKQIIDYEGIEKAVIAGHSMGGYTALALAALHPQYIQGLSLVHSMAYPDTEERKEMRRKAIVLVKKGGRKTFIEQMIPGLFANNFKSGRPEVISDEVDRGLKLTDNAIVAFYNAMINRPDRTSTLKNAAFPVQWIVGKEDNVAPLDKVAQQSMLADVNFVSVYTDCAHMSMLENPQTLVRDLEEFGQYCYS